MTRPSSLLISMILFAIGGNNLAKGGEPLYTYRIEARLDGVRGILTGYYWKR